VSLDADNDANVGTARIFDAGTGAFSFEDNALVASNVVIINFGSDDEFVVLNGDPNNYSFGTVGDDLNISITGPNGPSTVVLEGVADQNVFVIDEASAEQAVGNVLNGGAPLDFFQP
jgi:hypothetical protein